ELTFSKILDSFSSRSDFFYTLKCEEPEKSHFIVMDFSQTIRCLKWLFLNGPEFEDFTGDDEFRWFANEIRARWSDPIESVFSFLEGYIDGGDLVGFIRNNDGPAIITDVQAL
ncbi:hypothetical protein, partial [Pseudomonas aeruginosa]|uniref:hypothetical protein n=1 Tax=Pseudomonas aeruginosa TaxID=287 RepID=UPI001639F261